MPKIFEWNGWRFFFFSNEGIPREPRHVHVRKGERTAKFWLDPSITVASNYGLTSGELREIERVAEENAELIRGRWNEYFNV